MSKQFAAISRLGLSDRLRLMAFSIIILLAVALAAVIVTVFHFRVFPQRSYEQATRLAAVESLVFVIAGGLLLVRVCNPFLQRLEESEARVRAIVTLAGDGIITVNHEGTIETFNLAAERMFRYSQESVVGRSIDSLLLLPAGTSFQQALAEQDVEHFHGYTGDAMGRRHDGARFPVELSTSLVPLEERSICTVIVRDVTERDAAARQMRTQMLKLQEVKENLEAKAAELAKINRELDDFTYIASHDLKEPLRGISSYCQILLEDYNGKLDDDGQRRAGVAGRTVPTAEPLDRRLAHLFADRPHRARGSPDRSERNRGRRDRHAGGRHRRAQRRRARARHVAHGRRPIGC